MASGTGLTPSFSAEMLPAVSRRSTCGPPAPAGTDRGRAERPVGGRAQRPGVVTAPGTMIGVVLDVLAEPKGLGTADRESRFGVVAGARLVFLIDAQQTQAAPRPRWRASAPVISAVDTPAPCSFSAYLGQLDGRPQGTAAATPASSGAPRTVMA